MTTVTELSDLELAALIASKICHDVIGPVGAIFNGLEVLDDEDDQDSRDYALQVIRQSTQQASAKLQFARLAFGASGGPGAMIDMRNAEEIARGFAAGDKHSLSWQGGAAQMPKDKVKLLLNMVASGLTALPRGGNIEVVVEDGAQTVLSVRCSGDNARAPQFLPELLSGQYAKDLDALSIQAYYTCRLAQASKMRLSVNIDGNDIVLLAG